MSSVSFSRLEHIVAGYFMLKNYAVFINVPFRTRKGVWSDIDMVAFNNSELYIVECKRGSLSKKDLTNEVKRLVDRFNQAEEYLRSTSPYKELIDKLGLGIKKLYVAEYIRDEKLLIEKHNIIVRYARNILCETITLINKMKKEGAYSNQFIRFMVLLSKEGLLQECKNQPA